MTNDATIARLVAFPTVDLITDGARTGLPNRVEIWAWVIDGRYVITGTSGPRDWLANVRVNPEVVIHADGADFAGVARVITDAVFRRRVFTDARTAWYRTQESLEDLVTGAPMIEISFTGSA